jgi:biotin transport system substrate-specific component
MRKDNEMYQTTKTKTLILTGLFSALTAIGSMISIPLPFSPVPINLATLSVFLAGSLLGAKGGAISQLIYVFLGAIGLPVFHSFTGGLSILVGPTGGYLIGYIVGAYLIGIVTNQKRVDPSTLVMAIGFMAGLLACYTLGTLWFMYVAGASLWSALLLCVIPFLPGDGVKIVVAILLVKKLKPVLHLSE